MKISLQRVPQPVALAVPALLLELAFLGIARLQPLDENVAAVILLGLAASLVYFAVAWVAFSWQRSTRGALLVVLLAAVVFRATLFPLAPTLSNDLYRYAWEGEIQRAGHNPYLVSPADPGVAPWRPAEFERLPGKEFPTAYGPLTQMLFRLTAYFDGLAGFKLLSVAFDLATLLLLVGLLGVRREPPARALLYGWCPLVVLEFAGSGHNDSLALFALLLGNLLIIRQRAALSNVAMAAAAAGKWFAAVAAPVFLWRGRWRSLPAFAAVLLAAWLPYREAGWELFAGLVTYAEKWRNNESLYAVLMAATGEQSVATGVGLGVVGGLALYCAARRIEPLRACTWLLAAVLLFSASVFPWYVTWLVPFLCFYPHPALLVFTATVLLSYHPLSEYSAGGVWQYQPWLVGLEYLPVYGLLLWSWARRTAQRASCMVL